MNNPYKDLLIKKLHEHDNQRDIGKYCSYLFGFCILSFSGAGNFEELPIVIFLFIGSFIYHLYHKKSHKNLKEELDKLKK